MLYGGETMVITQWFFNGLQMANRWLISLISITRLKKSAPASQSSAVVEQVAVKQEMYKVLM